MLQAGPFAPDDDPPAAPAPVARNVSEPVKPAKAMSAKERGAQLDADRVLRDAYPQLDRAGREDRSAAEEKLRKQLKTAEQGPSDEGGISTQLGRDRGDGKELVALAEKQPTRIKSEGPSTLADEPPFDDHGEVIDMGVTAPSNPQLWVNARPGQTTWSVEANWSSSQGIPQGPVFLQIDFYRASDDKLLGTRNFDTDPSDYRDGDTTGTCLQWLNPTYPVKVCNFNIYDGMLLTSPAEGYYAKLSYATKIQKDWREVKPDTWQLFYIPHTWTSKTTSPTGPAYKTPGISEQLAGACVCPYQAYQADPVNTATGAVHETATDASVQGKGLPFEATRFYASNATSDDGLLGKGWRLPFETGLQVGPDTVTLTDFDGGLVKFTENADGTFSGEKPAKYTLTKTGDGYRLTDTEHSSRQFDAAGQVTKWVDGSGQGLTFAYDSGKLASVTDAAGRQHTLTVDAASGRLAQVDLADGRSVTYDYAGGQLTSATAVDGGVTKYGYDTGGRLATITDPNGKLVTQNTYDTTTGRITKQIDAHGGEYTFTWEPDPDLPNGSGESTMTDPAGGRWTDAYEAGVLIGSYKPAGGYDRRYFDQHLNVTAQYDDKSQPTTRKFDARGNVTEQTKGGVTQKFTWDSFDRVTSYTDGRGKKTTVTHEGSSDLPATVTAPAGTTTYTYTADGQVATTTEPGNRVTSYTYNSHGLVASETTPAGRTTTYTYDAAGRVKTTTEPRGNVSGADPAKYTTTTAYNAQGRVATITGPEGNTTSFTYDEAGNTTSVTDSLDRKTTYEYNAAGQVTKVTDPEGRVTSREYDKRGNLLAEVDPAEGRTTHTYDSRSRTVSTTTPRGNVTGADPKKYTTTYGYDDNGNQTKLVDPTGATTTTVYDELDRPVKVTDPMNKVTETGYDAAGNVTQVIQPHGKGPSFSYTDDNLLKTVTDALGNITTHDYGTARYKSAETSPLGNKATWTYNKDGQVISKVNPRGNVTGADPAKYTTTYGYDAAGNLTEVTDPLGNTTETTYNALGRQTSVTNPNGKTTTTAYDSLGRTTKVTAPDGGETSYAYSAGLVSSRTDANGHVTAFGYDTAGRLTSATDPLNREITYGYNADGHQNKVTNGRGVTTSVTYDALGRPTVTDYSDTTPDVTVKYDGNGNRLEVTDGTGARTFTYNPLDQLKTASVPGLANGFTYGYDGAGQLTKRTPPSGTTTQYTFDKDGRTTAATTGSVTTGYGYDATGNLTSTSLPAGNGYTENRTYDAAGRMTGIASVKGDTTLTSHTAQLDAAGQPVRVDQIGGLRASAYYTYDDAGRMLTTCTSATQAQACPSGEPTTSYTYDQVGNRTSHTNSSGAETTYTYDAADQLASTTSGSTTVAYEHDADGNRTRAGASTYTYDAENRLIKAVGKRTKEFNYDADSNRVTDSRSSTVRAWDMTYPVPVLAGEYDPDSTAPDLTREYRYNPLGQIESMYQGFTGKSHYYHRDLIGSITKVTAADDGSTVEGYSYDAFGADGPTLGTSDSSLNQWFGFAGEYKEFLGNESSPASEAGGYNLRARSYDPVTGRFTSTDPYTPGQETPEASPYPYADNAPTWLVDPLGRDACPPGAVPVSGDVCSYGAYPGPEPDETAHELLKEWVIGWGSTVRYYGPGSVLVDQMRRDPSMTVVRSKIRGQLAAGKSDGSVAYSVFDDGWSRLFTDVLSKINLSDRNTDAAVFIGSYVLEWKRTGDQNYWSPSSAVGVNMRIENSTTLTSLTHLPGPWRSFLEECIGAPLDAAANWLEGPFETITQILHWNEWFYPSV
ncbi:DUF6531 domain-containing protein [Streptomyces phytophilus]|uniref:DUF6531 domain-containing protein n=1 Tax=Streptomyces phytophilus TaxID=722715 RepID=UPI0015F09864|nr:DUF6531 domain-containing protein [Streptomyces phytophilus]